MQRRNRSKTPTIATTHSTHLPLSSISSQLSSIQGPSPNRSMGRFSRKPKDKSSYSYHSSAAQAVAARQLCELLNQGQRRMPRKALAGGEGHHFSYRDDNHFKHKLCINENGIVVPEADIRGGEGGNNGMGGGRHGGLDPQQIIAMQRGQFPPPGQVQKQGQMLLQAQMQQGIQQRMAQEQQMAQHMHQHQQHKRGHQPPAQPQQAPARDLNRPPFRNPFKDAMPQGFYGTREYVPGQEKIRVGDFGKRADDPSTSWRLMQALSQLRRRNG